MPLLSKVSIALLVAIALTLIGCGGSSKNPNPNNLTQAQAQQLGSEAFADVGTALADALAGSPLPLTSGRGNILAALRKSNQVAPAPMQITCNSSDTSCTVSSTYQCPLGGSIAVSGSLTANSSTSASGTITETPASCSDGTLVINGDPDVTIGIQGNDNGTTTTVNVTIGGGVSFSPVQTGQFPTGSCTSNLNMSASREDSTGVLTCSVGGSICGSAFNESCPNGVVL